jgi:hypothetical protein
MEKTTVQKAVKIMVAFVIGALSAKWEMSLQIKAYENRMDPSWAWWIPTVFVIDQHCLIWKWEPQRVWELKKKFQANFGLFAEFVFGSQQPSIEFFEKSKWIRLENLEIDVTRSGETISRNRWRWRISASKPKLSRNSSEVPQKMTFIAVAKPTRVARVHLATTPKSLALRT